MPLHHHRRIVLFVDLAVAIALVAGASSAAAQSTPEVDSAAVSPGWTVTPTLVFSMSRDSNVLAHEKNDQPQADVVNVINPRASLDFRGRHSQFSGTYDGAVLLYRNFGTLDSYDQRSAVHASHQFSPHLSVFGANTLASSPTTEALELAGIPFVRTGSTLDDLTGGVEAAFTKRTSMSASARFQWVQFDENRPVDLILRGGHSQGGSMTLRHRLSARTTITGDYSQHHAFVAGGQATFDVQNGSAGVEYAVSEQVRVFAGGGLSHLNLSTFGPSRTGPSYRGGVNARLQRFSVDVSYNRAYIPSFAFGGTMQNQDLTAQVRAELTRRAYALSSFSWRRNDPLTIGELSLRSVWLQLVAGYSIAPWARIEGFYSTLGQTIDRPGGLSDRTRFGVQIVTTQPMRLH